MFTLLFLLPPQISTYLKNWHIWIHILISLCLKSSLPLHTNFQTLVLKIIGIENAQGEIISKVKEKQPQVIWNSAVLSTKCHIYAEVYLVQYSFWCSLLISLRQFREENILLFEKSGSGLLSEGLRNLPIFHYTHFDSVIARGLRNAPSGNLLQSCHGWLAIFYRQL